MTTTVVFLNELKNAANSYFNNNFTKFKNIFRYSSTESRNLASILLQLNPADSTSIVDAVTAIDTYIQETGTSHYAKRRFWDDYLQPILYKLAQDPLTDLNDNDKTTLQSLEFASRSALNDIRKHSALLYNGMGYDESAVKRHPKLSQLLTTEEGLNACRADLAAETFKQPSAYIKTPELTPSRVLKLFFAQNIPLPNVQMFSDTSRKQQPFFDLCLAMTDRDELLILLKSIQSDNPSIKSVFPSILFKIAQEPLDDYLSGTEKQARALKQNQTQMNCLIELKRLDLESLTPGQLLSITTQRPSDFFREDVSNDELAGAIVSASAWNAVLSSRQGALPLTALLPAESAETILAAMHLKNTLQGPSASRRSSLV